MKLKKQLLNIRRNKPHNAEIAARLKRIRKIIKNALGDSRNNFYENN